MSRDDELADNAELIAERIYQESIDYTNKIMVFVGIIVFSAIFLGIKVALYEAGFVLAAYAIFDDIKKRKNKKRLADIEEEKALRQHLELKENKQLLEKQKKYVDMVNQKYLDVKDDPVVNRIVGNFYADVPRKIFLSEESFTLFEVVLTTGIGVVKKVLWSMPDNYSKVEKKFLNGEFANDEVMQIKQFIEGDFSRFVRLLNKKVQFESQTISVLTSLKLLYMRSSSFYANCFLEKNGRLLGNIEGQSLLDILYVYYRNCSGVFNISDLTFLTHYLIDNRVFGEANDLEYFNFIKRQHELLEILENNRDDFEFKIFEEKMKQKMVQGTSEYDISDVDLMTGEEFEYFVAKIFRQMGYLSTVTQLSGDYGIDVIAEKDGLKIGVQAKRYSGSVSNSAIQEVVAGLSYHDCQKGVVVTNSTFTKAAVKLAEANNIQLWDRKALEEKIQEVFSE